LAETSNESLSVVVLPELGLKPENLIENSGRGARRRSSRPKHLMKAAVVRNQILRRHIHDHLAMALEHAHQRGEPTQGFELGIGGEETCHAHFLHRITTLSDRPY
jgi:hypothetical protein